MAFEPCICAPSDARDDALAENGCGCRHGSRSHAGAVPLVAFFLLFALRRRSARRYAAG
jgi:MYXO-CTERM domain-containing protein